MILGQKKKSDIKYKQHEMFQFHKKRLVAFQTVTKLCIISTQMGKYYVILS